MTTRPTKIRLALAALVALLCAPAHVVHAQSASKAIVLGWDGAVPAFVHNMLRDGRLPHLAKLIAAGSVADDVKTVFPSKTAPGFASLLTGAPPRVTGISGNRVPRAPRAEFTILESLAGFSEAPLRAEPIWAAAERAGKKVVISHVPAFGGGTADRAVQFSGYALVAGRDGVVTRRAIQNEPSAVWTDAPASEAPPIEITFSVGETRFYGLLLDDPADNQRGYDTLIVASARDGRAVKAKLKPAPAGPAGELFWSEPIAVKLSGNQEGKCYFRLFDLKSDGSDLFLYYTRPARDLTVPETEVPAGSTVRTFIGNGASLLYQLGGFGRTIPNGGSGGAEARYLETVAIAEHQLIETNRWALDNVPWDLFLAYTPFPDEAEHVWRGYLDPALPNYRREIAEQLRPLLERVYQASDDLLGLFLSKCPPDTLIALVSDHGMEAINKKVALNRALQDAGLLALDPQGKIDLAKTRVIYAPINNGYLLINAKDRKNGIVAPEDRAAVISKTRELLLSIRDGDRAVVKAVYDAETEGAAMGIGGETGGDLYIDLAPGYDFDPRIASGALIADAEPYGNHGANPDNPAMNTLMVLSGPGIRAGRKLSGVSLLDLAPTLAWQMNFPTPKDSTGRVLFEAFDESHARERAMDNIK
jgi:predicted AlkP superfamily phosphohydrolase/phosphomutase